MGCHSTRTSSPWCPRPDSRGSSRLPGHRWRTPHSTAAPASTGKSGSTHRRTAVVSGGWSSLHRVATSCASPSGPSTPAPPRHPTSTPTTTTDKETPHMSISLCGLGGRRLDLEVAVRVGATAALLASATMHSTMAAEHYGDLSRGAAIFLVLQVLETSLAMAVISAWSMTTAVAVLVTSLASVALWLVSRATGVPVAPEDVKISWLGASDLICFALQLIAAGVVVPWILRALRSRRAPRRHRASSALGSGGGRPDDLDRLIDSRPGGPVREDAHANVRPAADGRGRQPHPAARVDAS